MATTRKHIQDAICKLDRELVSILGDRVELFQKLAAFDSDSMQGVKLLDNAVQAARKQKVDPDLINGVFSDLNVKFGCYELQARVDASIKAFREADDK